MLVSLQGVSHRACSQCTIAPAPLCLCPTVPPPPPPPPPPCCCAPGARAPPPSSRRMPRSPTWSRRSAAFGTWCARWCCSAALPAAAASEWHKAPSPSMQHVLAPPAGPLRSPLHHLMLAAQGSGRRGRHQELVPLQVPRPRHRLAVGAHLGDEVRLGPPRVGGAAAMRRFPAAASKPCSICSLPSLLPLHP